MSSADTPRRAPCQADAAFDTGNPVGERRTRWVALITAVTMIVEIVAGWLFNSMALTADGWHMGTHALALGLAALAYALARRYAADPRFAFGTWKIEILASYTSALALLAVAAGMTVESVGRLVRPLPISFDQAIAVAVAGLIVNLVCARLLHGADHHHDHHHGHDHHHDHADEPRRPVSAPPAAEAKADEHAHDLNLRAAYVHVLTDAATSVLAIVALIGGKLWGWSWLDPLMGIVGAALVAVWAVRLIGDSGRVLLDAEMDSALPRSVRRRLAAYPLSDLHVWRIGRAGWACVAAAERREDVAAITAALADEPRIVHASIVGPQAPAA